MWPCLAPISFRLLRHERSRLPGIGIAQKRSPYLANLNRAMIADRSIQGDLLALFCRQAQVFTAQSSGGLGSGVQIDSAGCSGWLVRLLAAQ